MIKRISLLLLCSVFLLGSCLTENNYNEVSTQNIVNNNQLYGKKNTKKKVKKKAASKKKATKKKVKKKAKKKVYKRVVKRKVSKKKKKKTTSTTTSGSSTKSTTTKVTTVKSQTTSTSSATANKTTAPSKTTTTKTTTANKTTSTTTNKTSTTTTKAITYEERIAARKKLNEIVEKHKYYIRDDYTGEVWQDISKKVNYGSGYERISIADFKVLLGKSFEIIVYDGTWDEEIVERCIYDWSGNPTKCYLQGGRDQVPYNKMSKVKEYENKVFTDSKKIYSEFLATGYTLEYLKPHELN